jgi:hypothetical protein
MSAVIVAEIRSLLARAHELLDHLVHGEAQVATDAKKDAVEVAHDAETAAVQAEAPVVAEAEADAKTLAAEAVTDATTA